MLNTSDQKQSIYPFIIHADPLWDEGFPYPTHTHGLSNIGLPEFIMDPLAFGGEGNAQRINSAYDYLTDPKNSRTVGSHPKWTDYQTYSQRTRSKIHVR